MRVLNKNECTEVLSRRRNGEPNWSIASAMNIPADSIRRIGACSRHHFPLEDYMIYDRSDYHFKPLGEKIEAWDIRLSMRLQRLPMSEWGAAV
jgi:hypothetical protein